MISYQNGNLFDSLSRIYGATLFSQDTRLPTIYVPHVVNSAGKWGAGFTRGLSMAYPQAAQDYRDWFSGDLFSGRMTSQVPPKLGQVLFSPVGSRTAKSPVLIAHMCAQVAPGSRPVPLDYSALSQCMNRVWKEIVDPATCEIHCPLFGAGLAGGDWWGAIEPMVASIWSDLTVRVYYIGADGEKIMARRSGDQ